MWLKILALLAIPFSLLLIGLGTYALVDPNDIELAMYDLVSPTQAASWSSAWNRAAAHTLVGGMLLLSAGIGMLFKYRWSMIVLLTAFLWLLLAHFPLFTLRQISIFNDTGAAIEVFALISGGILSILGFLNWNRFFPSPNKGFNRTPETAAAAKPGEPGGGAG